MFRERWQAYPFVLSKITCSAIEALRQDCSGGNDGKCCFRKEILTDVSIWSAARVCRCAYLYDLVDFLNVLLARLGDVLGTTDHLVVVLDPSVAVRTYV
jgi:hypothetical protein